MDVKVSDLMRSNVIYTTAKQTLGHVRTMVEKNNLSVLPVIDKDEFVVGIISIKDLLKESSTSKTVDQIMTTPVHSIPQYDSIQTAARMMRNKKIHHLVVTHEKKLVGILSSFDLLKCVENHRFVMKNKGTEKRART